MVKLFMATPDQKMGAIIENKIMYRKTKHMRPWPIFCLSLLTIFTGCQAEAQPSAEAIDFNAVSEQLLRDVRDGKDTKHLQKELYEATVPDLEQSLKTDRQKLAFWINLYNAYIQILLSQQPGLYDERNEFFKKEQIPIAGREVSFAKIEHGIIRKSQWEYGLGYIRKWFPGSFERKLRVDQRDYRIHFALNCGARSCPPVAVFTPERLDEQLNIATRNYLTKTSSFVEKENTAQITTLFKWFKGDFCGTDGIREILREYNVVPKDAKPKLSYKEYDWTLDLDNFTTL